jgi:hypothetical protein
MCVILNAVLWRINMNLNATYVIELLRCNGSVQAEKYESVQADASY